MWNQWATHGFQIFIHLFVANWCQTHSNELFRQRNHQKLFTNLPAVLRRCPAEAKATVKASLNSRFAGTVQSKFRVDKWDLREERKDLGTGAIRSRVRRVMQVPLLIYPKLQHWEICAFIPQRQRARQLRLPYLLSFSEHQKRRSINEDRRENTKKNTAGCNAKLQWTCTGKLLWLIIMIRRKWFTERLPLRYSHAHYPVLQNVEFPLHNGITTKDQATGGIRQPPDLPRYPPSSRYHLGYCCVTWLHHHLRARKGVYHNLERKRRRESGISRMESLFQRSHPRKTPSHTHFRLE